MKFEGEGTLLRIYVAEKDEYHGKPLFQAIVESARNAGLAGATVLRGVLGFGASSLIHAPAKDKNMPEDMPVVVEIADRVDKVKAFLPALDQMVKEGLITMEKVSVIAYRGRGL